MASWTGFIWSYFHELNKNYVYFLTNFDICQSLPNEKWKIGVFIKHSDWKTNQMKSSIPWPMIVCSDGYKNVCGNGDGNDTRPIMELFWYNANVYLLLHDENGQGLCWLRLILPKRPNVMMSCLQCKFHIPFL